MLVDAYLLTVNFLFSVAQVSGGSPAMTYYAGGRLFIYGEFSVFCCSGIWWITSRSSLRDQRSIRGWRRYPGSSLHTRRVSMTVRSSLCEEFFVWQEECQWMEIRTKEFSVATVAIV